MLRGSIKTSEENFDMAALANGQAIAAGIQHEQLLLRLADAVTLRDQSNMPLVRAELTDAMGPAGFADAAAVASAFQGFNRVADAAGTEIDGQQLEPLSEIRNDIGIDGFYRSGP